MKNMIRKQVSHLFINLFNRKDTKNYFLNNLALESLSLECFEAIDVL